MCHYVTIHNIHKFTTHTNSMTAKTIAHVMATLDLLNVNVIDEHPDDTDIATDESSSPQERGPTRYEVTHDSEKNDEHPDDTDIVTDESSSPQERGPIRYVCRHLA